jgi:hypothetical protein
VLDENHSLKEKEEKSELKNRWKVRVLIYTSRRPARCADILMFLF